MPSRPVNNYPYAIYGARLQPARMERPHRRVWLWMVPLIAILITVIGFHVSGHTSAAIPSLKSAFGNYCIDLQDDSTTNNTPLNGRPCRDNPAQAWAVRQDSIRHGNNLCVSVQGNSKSLKAPLVASDCSAEAGQVWLRDQGGLYNPNSGLCLGLAPTNPASQLITAPCRQPNTPTQEWLPVGAARPTFDSLCAQTSGGERVACFAEQQWSLWQSGSPSHESLLTQYTDGTPYEEWCADFVSYVYRQAGLPFTDGETDGWDENNANNIQYMGFTMHDPSTYTPKPGDVAYFDYNGGHVEIVVSGGKTPTFVYGNSATIDPSTDNGQMQANTITSDGPQGRLLYYLSPNL